MHARPRTWSCVWSSPPGPLLRHGSDALKPFLGSPSGEAGESGQSDHSLEPPSFSQRADLRPPNAVALPGVEARAERGVSTSLSDVTASMLYSVRTGPTLVPEELRFRNSLMPDVWRS